MGPAGSANWLAMLDGAEAILRDEGYAALTSRRVAERVGVKQRLVYYYFQTMDELIVETFRRLSVRELERLRAALASPRPLREIWEICIHGGDARMISEFMALANRLEGLRLEVSHFIAELRAIQVEALTAALAGKAGTIDLPPVSLAMLATGIALLLARETQLGLDTGHQEMTVVIDRMFAELEPE